MSGSKVKNAYFNGAGGVNEPTPGQPKYEKEPLNEDLRENGDKHMLVDDIGPVDGMHPGPASVSMSELERKKMLARAEYEEKTLRRNAIVNKAKEALEQKKLAYFQSGGGANEPTPGKTKYPPEKINNDLREDSDKHMTGQKPFPGVGSVDGLHPSPASADVADEKKRKEMLQRASLKARFVKASKEDGTYDLGKSAWEVYQGDKLILSASVNELTGNRANILYDSIATREFGAKLIDKIKVQGAESVRSLIKSAQAAAPAPAPTTEPVAEPTSAPVQAPVPEAADEGKTGDPKETAVEISEQVRDLSSDLVEAVRALTGEQAEMGVEEAAMPEMGATASNKALYGLRKELNSTLTSAMKEVIAKLNDHESELNTAINLYDKRVVNASNRDLVGSVVEDGIKEAKASITEGFQLMTAFVRYARGTKAMIKRAQIEAELESLSVDDSSSSSSSSSSMSADDSSKSYCDSMSADVDPELEDLINDTDSEIHDVKSLLEDEDSEDSGDSDSKESKISDLLDEELMADDNDANIVTKTPEEAAAAAKANPEATVEVDKGMKTQASRAELRAKLASEALKTSPILHDAHPKGSVSTELDVKPTGNLAEFEDLEDQHKAVMDLATAPPKVRKDAETIHRLVSEGKLAAADVDALVSEGVDKDAVAYYKKYYSQTDGGSEFASELVKEHVKAQLEDEVNTYKIKIARAYELAYDMVSRGLCHSDHSSITAQVDEIMKFNDDSFESLKKVVAKHSPIMHKEAGRIPLVGMVNSGETAQKEEDLVSQLELALSKTTRRMF